MDTEDSKKEAISPKSASLENNDNEDKPATKEDNIDPSTTNAVTENVEVESRRSSTSLDDEEEGKRNKRRKAQEDHLRKNSTGSGTSPKSAITTENSENEDGFKCLGSPGPKVPPLKIVIPPAECEQGSRNGKNAARHHGGLPYVVISNDETGTASSTVTTSPSSPSNQCVIIKEEALSPLSNMNLSNEEQRIQQRVLRSAHSSRHTANNTPGNGCTSGSSSNVTSGNSSPVAQETSPAETIISKDENGVKAKTESSKGKPDVCSGKNKTEMANKLKNELEEDDKVNIPDTRSVPDSHGKDLLPVVELHPRKRKLKSKPEMNHPETEHLATFGSITHPHEVPVTNCYQMFMDIRRQIDVKRKGLFPIQPKPPQGFKDYLMNRCTYTLAGNSIPRLKRRNAEPPEGIPDRLRDLYQEQEAERYSLRMQHVVEKEKLVLSVEQEILRVHGRAARALANQALPFSACTILKDEEVYNVITPEQEEKDRNARSRYNGRLFISWLQDVDDKWEKIKEEMLARHHKEAESLNAIQKFNWDLKMRQLGLWKKKKMIPVDENHVPMISVSDDFDLLPE